MLVRVFARLIEQDDLVDVTGFELPKLLADGIGGADEAATDSLLDGVGVGVLPLLEFRPDIDSAGTRTLSGRAGAIELA